MCWNCGLLGEESGSCEAIEEIFTQSLRGLGISGAAATCPTSSSELNLGTTTNLNTSDWPMGRSFTQSCFHAGVVHVALRRTVAFFAFLWSTPRLAGFVKPNRKGAENVEHCHPVIRTLLYHQKACPKMMSRMQLS